MTDAVREQIWKDAKAHSAIDAHKNIPWAKENFACGATHQHPIAEKAGYNQAIDEIIIMIDQNVCNNNIDLFWDVLRKKLEALKR